MLATDIIERFGRRKDKHLLFCCAGRVGIFGSTFPSIIEGASKLNLQKMSRMAGERGVVSVMPFEAPKAPDIGQTSPPGLRKDHEKYSAGASAAIRTS
jgi:hypothetical protein